MKGILNLIEEQNNRHKLPLLQQFAKANGIEIGEGETALPIEDVADRLSQAQEYAYALMTNKAFDGTDLRVPQLSVSETLTTGDVSVIFPRVISTILQEPREPALFLMNNVAEEVTLPDKSPISIEFPVVASYTAGEVGETGDYPNVQPSWEQFMVTMRLRKWGLMVSLGNDVIDQSQWNLIALNLRLMSRAIDRLFEEKLFQAMTQRAQVVFDNDSAATAFHTSGKSVSGSTEVKNYTFSYHDLVSMCGVVLGNRYNVTHFLAHPLAWPIFATDPILRAQFYHGGQVGQGIWSTAPSFDQGMNFPFGISYVPYYALPYSTRTLAATSPGSGLEATLISDVYAIDARHSLYMLTRGEKTMDEMDNWYRDAKALKAYRHGAFSVKDQGRGIAAAKAIRMARNEESLFTVRQVTS